MAVSVAASMIWRSCAAERREASAGPGRPDMLENRSFSGTANQPTLSLRRGKPVDAARKTASDNLRRSQKVPIHERIGAFTPIEIANRRPQGATCVFGAERLHCHEQAPLVVLEASLEIGNEGVPQVAAVLEELADMRSPRHLA